MRPGDIEGATTRLSRPESWDETRDGTCDDLAVRMTTAGTIESAWYPTPEEIDAMSKGSPVILTVWGHLHPPVSLNVVRS